MRKAGGLIVVWIAIGALIVQGAAWLLLHRRWRQMAERARLRAEHRIAERAQDFATLHDGLLQDVQGLALSLQAIAEQLPAQNSERRQLEHILQRADELLAEGRRRVRAAAESEGPP
jgi:hypothetical protein